MSACCLLNAVAIISKSLMFMHTVWMNLFSSSRTLWCSRQGISPSALIQSRLCYPTSYEARRAWLPRSQRTSTKRASRICARKNCRKARRAQFSNHSCLLASHTHKRAGQVRHRDWTWGWCPVFILERYSLTLARKRESLRKRTHQHSSKYVSHTGRLLAQAKFQCDGWEASCCSYHTGSLYRMGKNVPPCGSPRSLPCSFRLGKTSQRSVQPTLAWNRTNPRWERTKWSSQVLSIDPVVKDWC